MSAEPGRATNVTLPAGESRAGGARAASVAEMDVRPGGAWRFVSSGPDREDAVFYGEYLEVAPPERIKWTFMFDVEGVGPQGGPETLTLEDPVSYTHLTLPTIYSV